MTPRYRGAVTKVAGRPARTYRECMVVEVSSEAAEFIGQRGGRLWVWAAHRRMCCAGAPPWMHAATEPPVGVTGFGTVSAVSAAGVQVHFRGLGGREPGTLEIGLHGRRRPRVEAYLDGCLMAMP